MRFKVSELREYVATDPKVRILIVEGPRDIDFWKDVLPVEERNNCVVYSVEEIELASGEGGNKGAALRLAIDTKEWAENERIHYFLDADNDNLLGVVRGENVTLTDGRDLETYVLIDQVFERLCKSGASETPKEALATKVAVTETVRRVGVLRLVSERNGMKLPFQKTFPDGTLSRFFKKRGEVISLKVAGMFDALAAEAGLSHREKQSVAQLFGKEEQGIAAKHNRDIVHGKDLVAFIAWYFEIPYDIAAGLVRLAMAAEIAFVRKEPCVRLVEQWARAA